MASLMEIMQLCRLCLVKDQVNIPIFEEQGDIRQIFLKISACLPVKVSREDDLPKKICDGCSYKLEILYQFWNTSANSEKQLLKWLSQVGAEKGPASDKVAVAPVQPHSMPSDGVILKQEVVDLADSHSADEIAPDDLNVSSDAQDYIMQQQQLSYQPISFQFQQDGFAEGEGATNASGPSATVTSEATEAAPKRKRRAAAMKALPAHIDSEEEDEDDVDMVETKIAKTEEQSDDSGGEDPEPTAFVGVPSTSTDNEQPGPSGVGKGSAEAPYWDPLNLYIKPAPPDHEEDSMNNIWICNICSNTYANNADLKDHIFSQVLDMYICCRCGSKFVDEKTFRLHLRDHKSLMGHKQFTASPSGKLIDNRVNNMFICKYCDAPFRDRVDFYNHYVSHTSLNGKPVMKYNRRHTDSHVELQSKVRHVSSKKLTIWSHDMKFKVEKLHYGIKYRCGKCQAGFYTMDKSNSHADQCPGTLKACPVCQKIFVNNMKMYEHYELLHKDSRKMCKFCFDTYVDEKYLIQHTIRLHLQYSYYCYDCNLGFTSLYKFNAHLKIH